MEGITVSAYKGLKEYWQRKGYQRLNGKSSRRRRNRVELGSTQTRKGKFWRWRIKLSPKIRINRIPSPKKMLIWVRDAYVKMMMSLANSRVMTMSGSAASGFGGGALPAGGYNGDSGFGFGFGRGPLKEYDEKVVIQIYKSILAARGPLEVAPQR